ncbi:adenosine receptor A2a-like [Montipora capricornis]|uniref:adenosine receptor A2a-like n=1 Tax=Montipora capricornis TaxID=246305 RepID=UPI0035F15CB8
MEENENGRSFGWTLFGNFDLRLQTLSSSPWLLQTSWLAWLPVHSLPFGLGPYYTSTPTHHLVFLKYFTTLINVSVGHILLFSIDRFFAVVTPLQYRAKVTSKRVCIASVACWIYFLLFGFVFFLLETHHALMGTIYSVQIFCILICIVIINVLTLCRFHKYSPSTEALDEQHARFSRQMILQRERTVSKAIVIVISAFLLCFIPWFVVLMILYICLTCNFSLLMLVYSIAAAVVYANSAINPLLYAWRLPKYRETFKHIFKKRKCCGRYETRQAVNCVQDTRL